MTLPLIIFGLCLALLGFDQWRKYRKAMREVERIWAGHMQDFGKEIEAEKAEILRMIEKQNTPGLTLNE